MKEQIIVPINECTGIYGIYIEKELVYIGKTTQSFRKRFCQHKDLLKHPEKSATQFDLYYELNEAKDKGKKVELIPLIVAEYVPYQSSYKLNNRDLESMEFALILIYQPRHNIKGVKQPYKYSK